MPSDRGKAALYDDLVESLAALEEENVRLRAIAQRLADRLADREGITRVRALSEVISDITGEDVPATEPLLGVSAATLAKTRQRAGPGRW